MVAGDREYLRAHALSFAPPEILARRAVRQYGSLRIFLVQTHMMMQVQSAETSYQLVWDHNAHWIYLCFTRFKMVHRLGAFFGRNHSVSILFAAVTYVLNFESSF